MRGRFVVLLVLLVPLFAVQAASATIKDFGAMVNVTTSGNGQYVAMIQNTDITAPLTSFTFVPGPGLTVTSVVSSDSGTCLLVGSTFSCTGLNLVPAQCACVLGGIVNVTFTGSGSPGGSIIPYGAPVATPSDPPATMKTPAAASSTAQTATAKLKPSITAFTKTSGEAGNKVTITGKNFTGATAVKFGGVVATFTIVSATKITAKVPAKGKTGKISVTTKGGTATSAKSFLVA